MLRSAATPNRTECNRVRDETRHNPTPPTDARGAGRWRCRFTRPPKNGHKTPSAFACLGPSELPEQLFEFAFEEPSAMDRAYIEEECPTTLESLRRFRRWGTDTIPCQRFR